MSRNNATTLATLVSAIALAAGCHSKVQPPKSTRNLDHTVDLKYGKNGYCSERARIIITDLGYEVRVSGVYEPHVLDVANSIGDLNVGQMIHLVIGDIHGSFILPDNTIIPLDGLTRETLDSYLSRARSARDLIQSSGFVIRPDPTNANLIRIALSDKDMQDCRSAELMFSNDYDAIQVLKPRVKGSIPLAGLERDALIGYAGLHVTQKR